MVAATAWYDVVGALGAAVGGIGAAVGAAAAWRAASASRDASRDALEAIALGIAPRLNMDVSVHPNRGDRGRWTARAVNASRFAATDVRVEAIFNDGHSVRESVERLEPGASLEVLLREVDMPPGGPSLSEAGESLVLSYSDERGIARYEQTHGFTFRQSQDGPAIPTGSTIPVGELKRVS